jgi:hypothetical protein
VAGGALYTGLHLSVFLSFAFDAQAEDNRRREYEYEQEGHLRHYQKLARFNLKQVTRSSSNLNFTSSNTSTCSVPVKRHRGRTILQEFDVCITVSGTLWIPGRCSAGQPVAYVDAMLK